MTVVLSAGVLALATTAVASQTPGGGPFNGTNNPGASHTPNGSTGPSGSTGPGNSHRPLPANAKAYGFFCQKESKKHVAGQKGTPFSQCVTAMAKLGHGKTHNPAKACAGESKKHIAGQKGTPFSQCVSAAAKLLGSQNGEPGGPTGPTGATGETGPSGPTGP